MKNQTSQIWSWLLTIFIGLITLVHLFILFIHPTVMGVFLVAYCLGLLGPSTILSMVLTMKWWDNSELKSDYRKWQRIQSRKWEMWSRRYLPRL